MLLNLLQCTMQPCTAKVYLVKMSIELKLRNPELDSAELKCLFQEAIWGCIFFLKKM